MRSFVCQPGLEHQLAELRVSLTLGSVDGSREIALPAIGVLAEEDLGPPSTNPTVFEVTAHRFSPKPK
ncbi:MAG: hypothetical protein ABSE75_12190 [Acidimicrobiales bacterium]